MADVAFRHLSEAVSIGGGDPLRTAVEVSSAGTGPWHEGEPMDRRARAALAARGYVDHGHIAHQFSVDRFASLDLVVALDRRHLQTLRSLLARRFDTTGRIVLLRSFDPRSGGDLDVPDPYYDDGLFDRCLEMIEAGCRGLVTALAEILAPADGLAG
jgi:protein-tyrosine phosphatase